MPNKYIDEFLDYYIDDKKLKNPQYAVLLKGKWGSGKTHFINSYKKHLDDEIKQKYIYVSLYGVTSYDEIETKFLKAIHPKLYNDKTIFAGKIVKGLFKATFKFDWDDDGKTDGSASAQIPNFKPEDLLNTNDRILIFDDLERCSVKIVDLLGYINYFVEHQSYKVILIANEEELKKTKKYKKIKEKLIGKTFEFKTDVNQAYESFVKELKNEEVFKIHKDTIIEVFEKSESNNLRLLRQGLFDFKRLYDLILKNHVEKEELIRDFINFFFIFIFETRSGNCESIRSLTKKSENHWDKIINNKLAEDLTGDKDLYVERNEAITIDRIYEKYKGYINNDIILSVLTWEEIIENSFINSEKIEGELLESKYYIDEKTESWRKLWAYLDLDDSNFDEICKDVLTNLNECKYDNLFQTMLISSTVLKLKDLGLIKEAEENILNVLEKQIDYIFEKKLVHYSWIFEKDLTVSSHSYNNLGFDTDFESYKKIKNYIENKILEEEKDIFRDSYNEIEDALKNNPLDLYKLLSHSNNRETLYDDKPIFAFIDINKLANQLIVSSNKSQYTFGGILKDRYSHSFYTSKLEEEFENIYQLKELIEKEAEKKEGKPSGYRLKRNLIEPFEKAIKDIEKYRYDKQA
jgi:hypothetical protein